MYGYCGNNPVVNKDTSGCGYWSGGCAWGIVGGNLSYKNGQWYLSVCVGPSFPTCNLEYNFDNDPSDSGPSNGWGWQVGIGLVHRCGRMDERDRYRISEFGEPI